MPLRHPGRLAVLAATPLLLVAGCGGDEPNRSGKSDPGPACKTEGTVGAKPASSLRSAVEPYLEPGHKLRIAKRFGDTAEVQLRAGSSGPTPATVTLVKTGEGWVVTSIARC